MPVLQPVRLVGQTTATQLVTGISDKTRPSASPAGAASQCTDYDFDQQSDPTSPIHLLEVE